MEEAKGADTKVMSGASQLKRPADLHKAVPV